MTRITTSCPRCGRIDLEPEDVTLVVSPHENDSWYLFDCSGCVQRVVKPAPPTVAIALGSVRITTWSVPAEVMERVLPGEAPVIGHDDLLDLILDLRRDDPRQHAQARHPIEPSASGASGCQPGAMTPSPDEAGSRPARPNAA
jgi:hypothetical protein